MLKNLIILFTFIMVILTTGCTGNKTTKIDSDDYAGSMVSYINYSGRVLDNVTAELQRDLDLNVKQTEILLLLKSDLLAKVPEAREMVSAFQVNLIELLEKETITADDVNSLYAELDVYNVIMRDTVITRLIELHSTLNDKQKEKLALYLDRGKIISTPAAKPVYAPVHKVTRKTIKMYRELKLTREQIAFEMAYAREMRSLFQDKMKTIKKEGLAQKEALKELILSDSIEIAQVDAIYQDSTALFDDMKEKTTDNIVAFHGMLSEQQKGTLAAYLSDFELD